MMFLLSSVCFPVSIKAQDTSWYSDSETVFTLTTAEQLIGFRSLIKSGTRFEGKTVKLGNDIDVSSTNWIAIGTFTGTFDGCGHTIKYSYKYDKSSCPTSNGLFGFTSNAIIKDLKVSGYLNVQSNWNNYSVSCGGIVGKGTNTKIINCCNNVQIEYDRYSYHPDKSYYSYDDYVGGICGYSDGCKISYCVNEAIVKSLVMFATMNTGGICGYAYYTTEITECENINSVLGCTENVTGYLAGITYQGGIVGRLVDSSYITYCRNTGNCMANNNGSVYLGGIAGSGNCKSCYVASERITSNKTPKAITSSGRINNCFVNNDVVGVSLSGTGVNFDYSLSQMKTVDFVNALNETAYMWVGGENVLPVVLGSMNETEDYTTRPNPETIVLNMNDIDIPVESEMQLTAMVLPEGAWQTVLWESSSPEIVSVTDNGLLSGNAVGNATITVTSAKDNSITSTCKVNVGTREVKQIVLPESINVHYAEERQLDITILPSYADMNLVYESADENIATINEGIITGVGVGETVVTVKDKLSGVQKNCNVVVYLTVGDIFKANIPNGTGEISTMFVITDIQRNQVCIGDGNNAAFSTATTGNIIINPTVVGSSNLTFKVIAINDKAFYGTNISSVTIPQEIESIGANAFNGCSNLSSVNVSWTDPIAISSGCFSNAANATLNIPRGCYEVYAKAPYWKLFKTIAEPPHLVGDQFDASVSAGSSTTKMAFKVIDAENKYVSVGMGIDEELGLMTSIPDYTSGRVVIPSTVKGHDGLTYKVTQLSAGAFFGCAEVTSVALPSTVTEIGQAAFYGCAALSSFTIPSSVTTIGDDAFSGCSGLSSIAIPATVASLGNGAFYDCNKLTSVTVNWSMPIAIDKDCFTNAANATLNVPKGSYENYAVADNWKNFKTLKEPAHSIDETFVAYVMANGVKTSARYKVTNTTSKYVSIGNGEESAISDFTSGTVVVPASVTGYDGQTYQVKQVSPAAFFGCSEVSSIELPSGITSIGQAAFYMCSALLSFTIPTTVTSIGKDAFSYCENLQEIWIPKNVTTIGSNAFTECGNLTSVTVEWTNPISVNSDCFSNASNATLYVPCETKELYGSADGWEMFKEIVEIYKDGDVFKELIDGNVEMTFKVISAADKTCQVGTGNSSEQAINKETAGAISIPRTINGLTVEKISDYALFHCESLSDITIPNSVTSIGMNALRGCYSLRSIIVPSSVNSIGLAALACNKNLESIVVESGNTIYDSRDNCNAIICTATNELISGCKETIIPNSVTSIGRSAFNECYNLSEMTIPTSVTSIGQWAFFLCSGLTRIDIPATVTSIGQEAFRYCSNLTTVSVEWDEPITIDYNCFSNAANAVLYVPVETNFKYKTATGWKNFGQIVNKTKSILFAGDVTVCRGGQITVPIMLSNKDNVRNVQFELALPEGFSVVTNEMGELVGASLSERAKATHTITGTPEANGNYRVMIMPKGITDDVIQGSEGLIANIKLKVKLNVVPSDYDIKMTACELGIDDEESYSAILQDGYSKLTVSSVLLGDIKGNGEVTVTDVSNLIDYLLHKKVSNFTMHAADINGDGKISVTDISILIDILLHKTVFGEKQALKIEEISQ